MTDKELVEYLRTNVGVHPDSGKRQYLSEEDIAVLDDAADRLNTMGDLLRKYGELRGSLLEKDTLCERIEELNVYADQQKADQRFGKHLTEKLGIKHEFRHVVGGALYLLYAEVEKLRDENAKLHQTAQAVIHHDERGQGLGFQNAMDRLHRLVIEDKK